jgi:hypothetical protein
MTAVGSLSEIFHSGINQICEIISKPKHGPADGRHPVRQLCSDMTKRWSKMAGDLQQTNAKVAMLEESIETLKRSVDSLSRTVQRPFVLPDLPPVQQRLLPEELLRPAGPNFSDAYRRLCNFHKYHLHNVLSDLEATKARLADANQVFLEGIHAQLANFSDSIRENGSDFLKDFLMAVLKEVESSIDRAKTEVMGTALANHSPMSPLIWNIYEEKVLRPRESLLAAVTEMMGRIETLVPALKPLAQERAAVESSSDLEAIQINRPIQAIIHELRSQRDLQKKRADGAAAIAHDRNRKLEVASQELRRLREGRLVELQFMKQRTRSKMEKLKALHQMEIDALVQGFHSAH